MRPLPRRAPQPKRIPFGLETASNDKPRAATTCAARGLYARVNVRRVLAEHDDRRKYRRIRAPLYCRPAGMDFLARQRQPIDVSLGGVRIYSDDPLKIGQLLKLEFFTQAAPPVTYTAEVVWIEPLADKDANAPARFDVGLKFLQLEPDALKMLVSVLGPLEGGSGQEAAEAELSELKKAPESPVASTAKAPATPEKGGAGA